MLHRPRPRARARPSTLEWLGERRHAAAAVAARVAVASSGRGQRDARGPRRRRGSGAWGGARRGVMNQPAVQGAVAILEGRRRGSRTRPPWRLRPIPPPLTPVALPHPRSPPGVSWRRPARGGAHAGLSQHGRDAPFSGKAPVPRRRYPRERGSRMAPMNRIVPLNRSRITNRYGRFTLSMGGADTGPDDDVVTAAASVPFSSMRR
jgi:hypothetical protein